MGGHRVIDIPLDGHVLQQFGEVQGILNVTTYFARTTRKIGDWSACMHPHVAIAEFDNFAPIQWGWHFGVENTTTITQYSVWWIQHRPIPLTNPIVPIGAQ